MNRNVALAIAAVVVLLVAFTMGEDGVVDQIAKVEPNRQPAYDTSSDNGGVVSPPQRSTESSWGSSPPQPQPIGPLPATPMVNAQGTVPLPPVRPDAPPPGAIQHDPAVKVE